MRLVLVVAAERRELVGILRILGKRAKVQLPIDFAEEGERESSRFLLIANGAGPSLPAKAVDAASQHRAFDAIVSTGFCGGLDPSLQVGDIVVADRVDAVEQNAAYPALAPSCAAGYRRGVVVSQDKIAQTIEEKRQLRARGAAAVEMEAAAVAERANRAGLPFFCVRVVSDTADQGFLFDLNTMRDADGRFQTSRILGAALASPMRLVPQLFRLQQQSSLAARNLGDFFADCRF